jgi:cytochrome c biogenesis protein CcdA
LELLFGYAAGLLTLINPCVLPVLPIILGSVLRQERGGPLALAAGMSLSFVILGVAVATLGPTIGLDADLMASIGSLAMIGFGVVLIVPALNVRFAAVTAGISNQADQHAGAVIRRGLGGHFVGGVCLGAAWSPCIGPTLGGAISMASQGQSLLWSAAIMTSFALGTSTIILLLAYGARETIVRRQAKFQNLAKNSKTIMAIALVGVGLAILLDLPKVIDAWAIQAIPIWLQDLSVAL